MILFVYLFINKKELLRKISKNQVLDRIRFENPWWKNGQIESDYDEMNRRLYFDLFKPLVSNNDVRRAVVLMGPRRVGKTVMLYHMVQDLINGGHNPKKIAFITIENPIYNNVVLDDLYKLSKEASGDQSGEDWVIIFDEIQYCKDWELHLKTLVDSYRNVKFVVSGSAAAALNYASTESGAGRFTDFLLPPLTFYEYIHLKGYDTLINPTLIEWSGKEIEFFTTPFINDLNEHFLDYINFGGYPEVIFSDTIKSNPGRYIRQDIIDKVLLRDLPSIYGINNTLELNSLFTTISYNTGAEFSLETLSKESQLPKNTIKRYLEYLEAAFLIKKVSRIDQSGKRFKRENYFKLYLTNPSLRSALFSPISANSEHINLMVETAIFSQWMHRDWFTPWYARWNKGEVDLVELSSLLKPAWAVEIKWTDRYFTKPNELKSLISFCKENGISNPIVTTVNIAGNKSFQGLNFQFVQAACYAYTVGRKTIQENASHLKVGLPFS